MIIRIAHACVSRRFMLHRFHGPAIARSLSSPSPVRTMRTPHLICQEDDSYVRGLATAGESDATRAGERRAE